jgi:hypothetical protein
MPVLAFGQDDRTNLRSLSGLLLYWKESRREHYYHARLKWRSRVRSVSTQQILVCAEDSDEAQVDGTAGDPAAQCCLSHARADRQLDADSAACGIQYFGRYQRHAATGIVDSYRVGEDEICKGAKGLG